MLRQLYVIYKVLEITSSFGTTTALSTKIYGYVPTKQVSGNRDEPNYIKVRRSNYWFCCPTYTHPQEEISQKNSLTQILA